MFSLRDQRWRCRNRSHKARQLRLTSLKHANGRKLAAVVRQRVNVPDFHTHGIARVRRGFCLVEPAGAKRQHHLHRANGEQDAPTLQGFGADAELSMRRRGPCIAEAKQVRGTPAQADQRQQYVLRFRG